jgi:hypothetical protein
MGDDNKLVFVSLFTIITTNFLKNDNNKLVVVAHFHFKQKKTKWVTIASLLPSPYSQQQQ